MFYRLYRMEGDSQAYLLPNKILFTSRKQAGIFTAREASELIAAMPELNPEPVAEDEAMRLAGAPQLPGF